MKNPFRMWGGSRMALPLNVVKILDDSRFYTCSRIKNAWNEPGLIDQPILYPLRVLRWCSDENARGMSDWRMMFEIGMSLKTAWSLRNSRSPIVPPAFFSTTFWLREGKWAEKHSPTGYYLINFTVHHRNMSWYRQEQALADRTRTFQKAVRLGGSITRLPENLAVESAFSIYLASGKRESILEDDLHCGPSLTSYESHVMVGYFTNGIMSVIAINARQKQYGVLEYIPPFYVKE